MENDVVFLDRDGVINVYRVGCVKSWEEFEFLPNTIEAIKILNKLGKVIVITNQAAVARNLITEEELKELHKKMVDELKSKGAEIDFVYYCPHHPEKHHKDIPESCLRYRVECECRKPGIGMLKKAVEKFNIDLNKSFFVGDQTVDIKTGQNAGCKTVLVKTGQGGQDGKFDVNPDFVCDDILHASKLIWNRKRGIKKALILAGGKGTRMGSLTKDIPKPMLLVSDKPILEHQIKLLKKHGITDIILSVYHMHEKIEEYFGDGSKFGVNIEYLVDKKDGIGTGGAIKNAERLIDTENFLVLNGDVVTNIDLFPLIEKHLERGGIATLVLRNSDHPEDSDVVEVGEDGKIINFVGRGQEEKRLANTGIFVFNKCIFDHIPDGASNIEKDVIFKMINRENVYSLVSSDFIKDIGTAERYESVKNKFG